MRADLRDFAYPLPTTPWNRQVERAILDPKGRSVVGFSTARSNGKSVECARLALFFSAGEGHLPGFDVLLVGPTMGQAAIIFDDAVDAYTELAPNWRSIGVRIRNSGTVREMRFPWNVRLMPLAGVPSALTGRRFRLALMDEVASFPEPRGERCYNLLTTGLGKCPGGRVVITGTRAADPAHWSEPVFKNSGLVWSTPHDADPFSMETWKLANPSLGHPGFEALEDALIQEAEEARTNPAAMRRFRSLRLNQGVSDTDENFLLEPHQWRRCEVAEEDLPPMEGQPVWGIDMSQGAAMTAICSHWTTGRVEVLAFFPDTPSLADRARKHAAGDLYARMHQREELLLHPGRTVDARRAIQTAPERFGQPRAVAFDRWRMAELRDALDQAGLGGCPRTRY